MEIKKKTCAEQCIPVNRQQKLTTAGMRGRYAQVEEKKQGDYKSAKSVNK